TYQHKTCNTCRYNSSLQYKQSNKPNTETNSLTAKEMSRLLYEKILAANINEYLKNDSMGIDFECELLIDTMDSDSKTLSKKIVELIGESVDIITSIEILIIQKNHLIF
ncbi:14320_t:CDS:1, partial [Racocetra fulgida]